MYLVGLLLTLVELEKRHAKERGQKSAWEECEAKYGQCSHRGALSRTDNGYFPLLDGNLQVQSRFSLVDDVVKLTAPKIRSRVGE